MEAKNLWGDLELDEPVRTPAVLLKEQADALTNLTRGVLEGVVSVDPDYLDRVNVTLSIIAPAIGGYKLDVLRVKHGLAENSAVLYNLIDDSEVECKDEIELTTELSATLKSDKVHRIIRSLIAQSKVI